MAVGKAEGDTADAASRACEQAILGEDTKLLVVFCSQSHDLQLLVDTIAERSGGVPMIGCSTAGEYALGGPGENGVVVTALGGEGFSVTTAVAGGASKRLRESGAEAAACMSGVVDPERPNRVLMLLTDGLAGDQQEIVRGAYSVTGASVPLVGGCAGDDLAMKTTYQFHGREVMTDGVVAAAIASDSPFGIGVRHGWRRVGEPMLVTESANNRVFTLDERPALQVYLDRLDAPEEARTDEAAFTRFALTHPLGMSRRSGEEQVRFIGGADFADGSLSTIAEVPPGALVWSMEGDDESVLAATDGACDDALAGLDGRAPLGVIAFDCIARRGVLGEDGIKTEVEHVAERAGGAPVAGFYTYGEIARTNGVSGFHNQTLVVLSVS
ncbi:MAG: hypothetical protein QOF37_2688 [Thermoleophilaceae bacterium]|nr:hypothetical protein [Thermoleophilaceae bacterium]